MDLDKILRPRNRDELRQWLMDYSRNENECWVVTNRNPEELNLTYLDIVEEAICFGWIDSTKKKLSESEVAQRISPRRKKSKWTELNKERARRLIRLDLMTEWGEKVLPDLSLESFTIHPVIMEKIQSNPTIKENFEAFPELYQRIRIDTIQSYINDEAMFNKRLNKFLENTEKNKMYGAWDDKGLLSKD